MSEQSKELTPEALDAIEARIIDDGPGEPYECPNCGKPYDPSAESVCADAVGGVGVCEEPDTDDVCRDDRGRLYEALLSERSRVSDASARCSAALAASDLGAKMAREATERAEAADRYSEKALDERDYYQDQIARIAAAVGCGEEWSNLHAHACCIDDAFDAMRERAERAEADRADLLLAADMGTETLAKATAEMDRALARAERAEAELARGMSEACRSDEIHREIAAETERRMSVERDMRLKAEAEAQRARDTAELFCQLLPEEKRALLRDAIRGAGVKLP